MPARVNLTQAQQTQQAQLPLASDWIVRQFKARIGLQPQSIVLPQVSLQSRVRSLMKIILPLQLVAPGLVVMVRG